MITKQLWSANRRNEIRSTDLLRQLRQSQRVSLGCSCPKRYRELRATKSEMLEQIPSSMDPDKVKRAERLARHDWDRDVRNYVKNRKAAMTDEQVEQALDFTLKEMEQRGYNEAQIELMRSHWRTIMDGDREILDRIILLEE